MSVRGANSAFDHANGKFGGYAAAQETEAAMAATGFFNRKLFDEGGHFAFDGALRSASTATVVDATGFKAVFTDQPYLENKEWLEGMRGCRGGAPVRGLISDT